MVTPGGPLRDRKVPKTIADRALALGGKGNRIALGIATLDRACRGGPLTGKVIVFGASPGTGKTTLIAQIGHELARRKVWVAILSADEDADGLLIRIGQNERLSREDLEGGNHQSRAVLAGRLRDLSLLLFDADEDEATIELVAAELAHRAKGAPSVLIVDSIQTACANGSTDADNPRARTDAVMLALKRMAKMHGHLVIATSEVSRGWYKNRRDRVDPMAAFKESGGIEYAASMALVMVPVEGHENLVDVLVPKNRMGQKLPFRLKLCFARARFEEVELTTDQEPTPAAKVDGIQAAVVKLLSTRTDLGSKNAVYKVLGGNRNHVLRAIADLIDQGAIANLDGALRLTSIKGGDR